MFRWSRIPVLVAAWWGFALGAGDPPALRPLEQEIQALADGKSAFGVDLDAKPSRVKSALYDAFRTHFVEDWENEATKTTRVRALADPYIGGAIPDRRLTYRKVDIWFTGKKAHAVTLALNIPMPLNTNSWIGVHPLDFLGWSSKLGNVYTTSRKDLYLVLGHQIELPAKYSPTPRTETTTLVIRILQPEAFTNEFLFGARDGWHPWSAGESQLRAALAQDPSLLYRNADFQHFQNDRPLVGTPVDLMEQAAALGVQAFLGVRLEFARNAKTWDERVRKLKDLQKEAADERDYATRLSGLPPAVRRPMNLQRRLELLKEVAREVLPEGFPGVGAFRMLRESAIAVASGAGPDELIAIRRSWLTGRAPKVVNLEAAVPFGLEPNRPYYLSFSDTPLGKAAGEWWKNQQAGTLGTWTLSLGQLDLSGLGRVDYNRQERQGGWVKATPEELAAQARLDAERGRIGSIPDRLAAIERELNALDTTPLGREVQGGAAEDRVYRYLDAAGTMTTVTVKGGQRNTYLFGVGEDARQREVRRKQLREERNRLKAQQGQRVDPGQVVNGMVWKKDGGPAKERPGYILGGKVHKPWTLTGPNLVVTELQRADYTEWHDAGTPGDLPAITQKVRRLFELPGREISFRDEGYFSRMTANITFRDLFRKALIQALEQQALREGGQPVESIEADLPWARALLYQGAFPYEPFAQFALEGK